MSHFTTIKTQIRDIPSLSDACADLELSLVPDAFCRGYAGVTRHAPFVIKLKGPYDIAVDHSAENDGSYGLTADWWDGHVAKEVGAGYGRLLQSYGVHRTLRATRSRGLRATRRLEADGSVLLTLEGGSL
ncbi:MAG: DUF1257 domain-containing protein [Verrucomicrobiaceae bacterium]|nr:MAG: DUF1257 domain-containing protein [Verrucomicrobiaceae bacterium]